MTKEFYLIIKGKKGWQGNVSDFTIDRFIKTKPTNLSANEIAIKLLLNVPSEFFNRVIPSINIELPKEAILTLDQEAVISMVAQDLSQKLSVTLEDATDGLQQILAKSKKEDE